MRLFKTKGLLLLVFIVSFFFLSAKNSPAVDEPGPSWIKPVDLKVGDLLRTETGWTEIESIDYVPGPITVYNLTTQPHAFFANGILAHNQKAGGSLWVRVNGLDENNKKWGWACGYPWGCGESCLDSAIRVFTEGSAMQTGFEWGIDGFTTWSHACGPCWSQGDPDCGKFSAADNDFTEWLLGIPNLGDIERYAAFSGKISGHSNVTVTLTPPPGYICKKAYARWGDDHETTSDCSCSITINDTSQWGQVVVFDITQNKTPCYPNCTQITFLPVSPVVQGIPVTVSAYATIPNGAIKEVEFYRADEGVDYCTGGNWTSIGKDTASSDGWYSIIWDTAGLTAKTYKIAAVVRPADGQDQSLPCTGNPNGICDTTNQVACTDCNASYTVNPGCLAPSAPTNVAVSQSDCQDLKITWQDNSSDEEGFRIYKDGIGAGNLLGTKGVNKSSFTCTNCCTDNSSHTYYVVAYKTCPDGEKTSIGYKSYTCVDSPPNAVVPIDVNSSVCSDQVTFSWTHDGIWGCNIGGATPRFRAQYRPDGGSWIWACDVDGGVYSCPAVTVTAGTTYEWRVRASNDGDSPATTNNYVWQSGNNFSRNNSPPSADAAKVAPPAEINSTTTSLQWSAPSIWGCNLNDPDNSERHYDAYLRAGDSSFVSADLVDGTCSPFSCANCDNLTSRRCSPISNLSWGTTYYWKVRSCNSDSSEVLGTNCTDSTPAWSFTPYPGPWWQVFGGSIYASTTITSEIPGTVPASSRFLMGNDISSGYHGVPACSSSGCLGLGDKGAAWPGDIAEGTLDWHADGSAYNGETYSYDGWTMLLKDETINPLAGPGLAGQSGIKNLTGSSISGNVGTNKLIILKDGDVNITGNITVGQDGFLMVVASGTITINDSLGGSLASPAVQGVFIADQLSIPGKATPPDSQLFMAGTFVGWSGVTMERNIGGVSSTTLPSITVIFRPDFLINAPPWVKKINFPSYEQKPG